jgi:hypothetical protein
LTKKEREIVGTTVPKEHRAGPAKKDKKQENLDEALRNAVNANNTRPRHKEENRMLWITYKRKQQQRQEERANEQQQENDRQATLTEQAWRDKNEKEKWAQRTKTIPKKGPPTLAKTYFDEEGEHIHGAREVLHHINDEVHSMANPSLLQAKSEANKRYERTIQL